jgi:hypothetical protein
MPDRVHYHPGLIYSPGTHVVALAEIKAPEGRILHPRGAVGVVVRAPSDKSHSYRVRFPDGVEAALKDDELMSLARYQEGIIADSDVTTSQHDLYHCVIYRCIIGSQAYGLAGDESDIDRRGIYLPPADLHWSLYGVPEQLESHPTQEAYWELQMVEYKTALAEELLAMRASFLSRLVYQTYNGYVMSQFKKMQTDIRNQGRVKWKHVMHLVRLLLSGTTILREGYVPVRVDEHRERLLSIKRGEVSWEETGAWRLELHAQFAKAFEVTKLPERPDYQKADDFLIKARHAALSDA